MPYADAFVLPIPEDKIDVYRGLARKAGKIWREHGALEYRECILDDANAHDMVPFPKAARVKSGETVVVAWIVYKSRAHRDKVNGKVMNDPRMAAMCGPDGVPFNYKRMAYGGFKVIVDA